MASTSFLPLTFIPIEMEVSTAIIRSALKPIQLDNLIAKIITLTVYPFLLIAAFEALLINGSRIMLNFVFLIVNSSHELLFSNQSEESESSPANPLSPAIPANLPSKPLCDVEMPSPGKRERECVEDIVKTLADGSISELLTRKESLEAYRQELKDLHPFQFLEAIFGENSPVKGLMPKLMSRTGGFLSFLPIPTVVEGFLGGFEHSMKNKAHRDNVQPYLKSFATKMGTTCEKVLHFLPRQQKWDWKGLVEHLIAIHSRAHS